MEQLSPDVELPVRADSSSNRSVMADLFHREADRRPPIVIYLTIVVLIALVLGLIGASIASSRFPDLRVVSVGYAPEVVHPGDTIVVSNRIGNAGQFMASPTTARFYLSPGKRRSDTSILLDGAQSVPSLDYATVLPFTTSVAVPTQTRAGQYDVLACADDVNAIPESNERNNCRSSSTQIAVTIP